MSFLLTNINSNLPVNCTPRKGRSLNNPYKLISDNIKNTNATQKYRALDDLPDWNNFIEAF